MSSPGLNSQGQGQGAGGFEPGFDENAPELSKEPLDLSTAREPFEKFHMPGNFFWIADATSTGSLITVTFNRDEIPENLPFGKGMYVKGLGIEDVKISHPAQGEEMTIVFGNVGPTEFDVGNLNESVNELKLSSPTPSPDNFKIFNSVTIGANSSVDLRSEINADYLPVSEFMFWNHYNGDDSDGPLTVLPNAEGTTISNPGPRFGIPLYAGEMLTLDWSGVEEYESANDQNVELGNPSSNQQVMRIGAIGANLP